MAFTYHGHHIKGTSKSDIGFGRREPGCTSTMMCATCRSDVAQAVEDYPAFEEMARKRRVHTFPDPLRVRTSAVNFTSDIDVAAWLGRQAAKSKNEGNKESVDIINNNLMELVERVSKDFQQAVMTAYTISYVKNLEV